MERQQRGRARATWGRCGALAAALILGLAAQASAQAGDLRFSLPEYATSEGAGSVTITVERVGGSSGSVSALLFSFDLSTTSGADWVPIIMPITFGPGVVTQTVAIDLIDDATVESLEEFMVGLDDLSGGAGLQGPNPVVVTINDDDAPGQRISFGSASYSADEDAGAIEVTLLRSGGSAGEVTTGFWTSDGSATAPADYGAVTGGVTFEPGVTQQTIAIPLVADMLAEGDETFLLHLGVPTGAELGGPVSLPLRIRDVQPAGGDLRWSVASLTAAEGAGSVQLNVERVNGGSGAVSVDYALGGGTASPGNDYAAAGGTLTWADGDVSPRTVTVDLLDDRLLEGDEHLNLTLANPSVNSTVVGPNPAVLTIHSDELPDAPGTLRWSQPTYAFGEGSGTVNLTLERIGGSLGSVRVTYFSMDLSAAGGSDFTPTLGELTFAPGVTSVPVSLELLDDATIEPVEELLVGLLSPTGSALLGSPRVAIVAISDDDTPGQQLAFDAGVASGTEGGSVQLSVTRSGGTAGVVTVGYWFEDDSALAGSDYDAFAPGIAFPDGVSSQLITIPLPQDSESEGSEGFLIHLVAPGGASLSGTTTAYVTIEDDEPGDELHLALSTYTPGEADGAVVLQVERMGGSAGAMTVEYATEDGSALAGSDYQAAAGTLSWADGDVAAKSVSVSLLNDGVAESGGEDFRLVLANPTGGARLGSRAAATVTIADDDAGEALPVDVANVYWIGASLLGWELPGYVGALARDAGRVHTGNIQMIYGEALSHYWDHHATWIDPPDQPYKYSGKVSDSHVELQSGRYDVLVLQEAIDWVEDPAESRLIWRPTTHLAGGAGFYRMAYQANPDVRVYVEQLWFGVDVGFAQWRQDILDNLPGWEAQADAINALRGTTITQQETLGGVIEPVSPAVDFPAGNPVQVIPSGLAFRELVTRIEAGQVPGLSDPAALFIDAFHTSPLGNYFQALVHYATIYRRSPVGISLGAAHDIGGGDLSVPAPATAAVLQEIAWEVVRGYPRSGVSTAP